MEHERVAQCFATRQHRRIGWSEQEIAPLDGVRRVNTPHPGFAGNTVQLLQSELRVRPGQFDRGDEAIRECRVRLYSGIVNDLRDSRPIRRRCPLVGHTPIQR